MSTLKNLNFSLTDNTVYAGSENTEWYSEAMLGGKSAQLFKLIPGVKSKTKLNLYEIGNIVQAADCTFSATGEGAISQKTYDVESLKVNLSFCKNTFNQNFMSEFLKPGSNNDEVMPATFQEYVMSEVKKAIARDVEKIIWQGDTASAIYPLNSADGLIKKLEADPATILVPNPVAISASNVVAKLQAAYDLIPEQLIDAEDLTIMVAPNVYRAYRTALATASAEVNFMQRYSELYFNDVKVEMLPGLPSSKIVAGRAKTNFLFLTDLLSDLEDIQILPQAGVTGEPTVRFTCAFKISADYVFASEIVLYNA